MSELKKYLALLAALTAACGKAGLIATPTPTPTPRPVDLSAVLADPNAFANQRLSFAAVPLVCINSSESTTSVTMPGFEDYPGMGKIDITSYQTRYGLVPDPSHPAHRLELTPINEKPSFPCDNSTIAPDTYNARGVLVTSPTVYLKLENLTPAE